jgi:membrane associated rhomboid family serine protease
LGRGYQQYQVRFGPPHTPDVVKTLILANVGVFIAQLLLPALTTWLSATPAAVWRGALWQPFTYMWLHSPSGLAHVGFNMLALWMFGSPLASAWGDRRFLRFYLLCGIGAAPDRLSRRSRCCRPRLGICVLPTLGARWIFDVLLAYSLTWPDRTIM